MMHKDEAEEKEWQVRSLKGQVISGLHTDTFGSIYGALGAAKSKRKSSRLNRNCKERKS